MALLAPLGIDHLMVGLQVRNDRGAPIFLNSDNIQADVLIDWPIAASGKVESMLSVVFKIIERVRIEGSCLRDRTILSEEVVAFNTCGSSWTRFFEIHQGFENVQFNHESFNGSECGIPLISIRHCLQLTLWLEGQEVVLERALTVRGNGSPDPIPNPPFLFVLKKDCFFKRYFGLKLTMNRSIVTPTEVLRLKMHLKFRDLDEKSRVRNVFFQLVQRLSVKRVGSLEVDFSEQKLYEEICFNFDGVVLNESEVHSHEFELDLSRLRIHPTLNDVHGLFTLSYFVKVSMECIDALRGIRKAEIITLGRRRNRESDFMIYREGVEEQELVFYRPIPIQPLPEVAAVQPLPEVAAVPHQPEVAAVPHQLEDVVISESLGLKCCGDLPN